MALRINEQPLESTLRLIAEQDFAPVDIAAAGEKLDMYSGIDEVREFDLAVRLSLIRSGETMHKLLARKPELKLSLPSDRAITVVTVSTQRELVDDANKHMEGPNAPFYLKTDSRCSGLFANPAAHVSKRYDPAGWVGENQAALEAALAANADIVSFGEFDYPSSAFQDRAEIEAAQRVQGDHDAVIKQGLKAAQRPLFVFAGSYHHWTEKSCVNAGMVFRSESDGRDGHSVHQDIIEKQTAAKGLGEIISPHPSAQLHYYATNIGRIGVLICLDAFDPGIATSIFANSRESNIDRLQYILVPSYNPSSKLLRSCQHLSYYGNCVVIYVNAMRGAQHKSAEVFICGSPLVTWKRQLDDINRLVEHKLSLDNRIFAAIPGLKAPNSVIQLADAARGLNVISQRCGTFELTAWTIPPEFLTKAAQTMAPKFPFNRARLIASLNATNMGNAAYGAR